MGTLPLWRRMRLSLVPLFWRLFCWASGYDFDGYVCDYPTQECQQWRVTP